jgi:hypothetical protein
MKMLISGVLPPTKSSGGEDDPTKKPLKAKFQGTSAWSNKDFCHPAFKSDVYSVTVPPPMYWISLGRPPPAPNWLLLFGTAAHLPRPPPAPNWLWIHPIHHQLLVILFIVLRRGKRIGEAVGSIFGVCKRFEAACIGSRLLFSCSNWQTSGHTFFGLLYNYMV